MLPRLSAERRRVVAFTVSSIVAAGLLHAVAVAALPYSALGSTTGVFERSDIQSVMPQGWGFFTRDPQEARLYVFVHNGDDYKNANSGTLGSGRWLFGLDRTSRAQGIEIAALVAAVETPEWVDCENDVATCLEADDGMSAAQVVNGSPDPTLCDRVAVVQQTPVPWAWASDKDDIDMPLRFLTLDASC